VATLTGLAPGSYLITGHAAAVNFGANDYVRCSIFANGTAYGGSTVFVGGNAGATTVADLTTIAPPSSSTTFDASLQCSHDNSPDGPYVESITLSAIQVNHLDARTSASTN
jgi:hypothetical protein